MFDNPWRELNDLPYEERYQELLESVDHEHPFIVSLFLIISCFILFRFPSF